MPDICSLFVVVVVEQSVASTNSIPVIRPIVNCPPHWAKHAHFPAAVSSLPVVSTRQLVTFNPTGSRVTTTTRGVCWGFPIWPEMVLQFCWVMLMSWWNVESSRLNSYTFLASIINAEQWTATCPRALYFCRNSLRYPLNVRLGETPEQV